MVENISWNFTFHNTSNCISIEATLQPRI